MKKMFSAIALSALIASPLTANHSEFADKPFTNSVSIKKEKGLFIRGLNCSWQLTKFFGGMSTIGVGFALASYSLNVCKTCALAWTIGCCRNPFFGDLNLCCDNVGTQCGKAGAIGAFPLWYLGWKSMKSGWNGLTKN